MDGIQLFWSNNFLLSQVFVAVSFTLTVISFQFKKGAMLRVLLFLAALFNGVHFILLSSYIAAAMIGIGGLRWLTSIVYRKNIAMYIFLVCMGVASVFMYESPVSGIPVLAGMLGTIAAFQTTEVVTRKLLFIATSLWLINNLILQTPVGIISESVFLISNGVGYYRLIKKS